MPYIITVRTPRHDPLYEYGEWVAESHRAVATLQDARDACIDACPGEMLPGEAGRFALQIVALGDQGGTVGPFADGLKLEVRPVAWSVLCGMVGQGGSSQDPEVWQPEVIDAYNATPDWGATALRLWTEGKTVREIAEAVDRPISEVSPFLGQRTAAAVNDALRGGGWK